MIQMFLILDFILVSFLAFCIYAVTHPDEIVQFTIGKYKRSMKFYGFEADIKTSEKSIKIIKVGHAIIAIIIVMYLIVINYFLI